MLLGRAILPLTPIWEREKVVVLAPSLVAARLRREEGCEDLPVREALWQFDLMDRPSSWGIRQFVSEARLTGVLLSEMQDWKLVALVRHAIKTGDLIALRKSEKAGKPRNETAEHRRLVGQIEQQIRGRIAYAGRQYKLVVDVDLGKVPDRDSYEVVGRDEARRVLDGLARQSGAAGDLAALLGQASAKLTSDWRPPIAQPDGLILLCRIIARAATVVDTGPAMTPSQILKAKLGWIIVDAVDDLDEPWDEDAEMTLTDGSKRSYNFAGAGVLSLENIEPGTVTVDLAWRRSQPPG